MTTECPALRLRGVTFRYQEQGTRNILDHVDLDVKAGGLTVLMGGSGCGKSTLAAVAAGLYPENGGYLEGGDIEIFGHPLREMNPQQRADMMGLYYARRPGAQTVELDAISAMPYAVRAAMSQNLYTGLQLSTRLLAYAGLGILFALSTDSDFFISSLLHQCHLPPKFAYGILAAFHLIPGMIREYRKVRTAYAVRGVRTHAWSVRPMFTMLVNSVRWSESVAMAMESKGFCGDAPRTYYRVTRIHAWDWLLAAACIGGLIAGMMMLQY